MRGLFSSRIEQEELDESTLRLRVYDAAVFTNYLSLKRRLDSIPAGVTRLVLDLERTRLVDHTVIEKLGHTADDWQRAGRRLEIIGLSAHTPLAAHELSARRKPARINP